MKEQDVKKAQSLWEEALKIGRDSKSKAEVFKAMREQSMKSRDYQQANNLADSIMKYQNNYYDKREQDRIAEIQAKYDKDAAEKELRSAIQSWGLGIITLLALVFGVLSYMSYRGMKAKKDLNETRWLLESYKKQAEELSASGNVNAKEIMALHKKIDELQQRHSGILAKGKVLYEAIQQGGTTILWKKEDFLNYLEYYKMIDLPFLNKMDTDFDGLSPKYTFFAILEHEGKSDEDLQRILGISESTLRSTRSRINSKRR